MSQSNTKLSPDGRTKTVSHPIIVTWCNAWPIVGLAIAFLLVSTLTEGSAPESHPLDPAIAIAQKGLERIHRDFKDYSAVMVKREQIGGKLKEHQYMIVKVRHEQKKDGRIIEPFAAYLRFLKPKQVKDREVIFVRGRNNGKMIVHDPPGTITGTLGGTLRLKPKGLLAMQGNRYPIMEIGIENLTQRLLAVARSDRKHQECEVHFYKGAKVNQRICTKIEVIHPHKRSHFQFHIARVYLDDEFQVPIRYESYDWPQRPGERPSLLEEYTYLELKFNVGLTDMDFDHKNPAYQFP